MISMSADTEVPLTLPVAVTWSSPASTVGGSTTDWLWATPLLLAVPTLAEPPVRARRSG